MKSLWLKYSKAEEELYSTAAWSPPPIDMLSNINKVVGSVVQIFADHKGSFPRGDNLCISV